LLHSQASHAWLKAVVLNISPELSSIMIYVSCYAAVIHDVQGAGHWSPRLGSGVITLQPAIVTGRVNNGFYIQVGAA
jgi:hypothetical protein